MRTVAHARSAALCAGIVPFVIDSFGAIYDALGRMVELNNSGAYTEIVYGLANQKLALMSGQTLEKAYVATPSGTAVYTASGLSYYRHADWLGSSRFASTTSRTMYSSSAYAPFGEPYAATGTSDQNFTGQQPDTTSGLYDFLFRRLSQIQGRWISPDPAGIAAVDPANPQSWNRYAYVTNNPLALVDPLGLDNDPVTVYWGCVGNSCNAWTFATITVPAGGSGMFFGGGALRSYPTRFGILKVTEGEGRHGYGRLMSVLKKVLVQFRTHREFQGSHIGGHIVCFRNVDTDLLCTRTSMIL